MKVKNGWWLKSWDSKSFSLSGVMNDVMMWWVLMLREGDVWKVCWLLYWDCSKLLLCFIFLFIIICVVLIIACILVVYFLVFSVCEGLLGLSILVSIICSQDNDYFQFYVFFNVKNSLFFNFFDPCVFSSSFGG
jgi:hypothetical protein